MGGVASKGTKSGVKALQKRGQSRLVAITSINRAVKAAVSRGLSRRQAVTAVNSRAKRGGVL